MQFDFNIVNYVDIYCNKVMSNAINLRLVFVVVWLY